jgi:hypothetical protein
MGNYVYGNRKLCQLPKTLATDKMVTVAESSLIIVYVANHSKPPF